MNDLRFHNSYTFSKCICEHLLLQGDVDTIIIRPSIVGPAVESPFEGWAGAKPSTLVAAACLYLSYQWNIWCFGSDLVPCIPVDILSRFIVAKAFGTHTTDAHITRENSDNSSLSDDSFEKIGCESSSSNSRGQASDVSSPESHLVDGRHIVGCYFGSQCCIFLENLRRHAYASRLSPGVLQPTHSIRGTSSGHPLATASTAFCRTV
jgi:hypothetical protein